MPRRSAKAPATPKRKLHTPRPGQFGHRTRAKDHKTVAARGGRKAHQLGGAHEYTPEEARAAGQKSATLLRAKIAQKYTERQMRQDRIAERLTAKGVVE